MTITVPSDIERALSEEAERRGTTPDLLAREILSESLSGGHESLSVAPTQTVAAGEHDIPNSQADGADRALAFYKSDLAHLLEPTHNGEDVAIHVDTKTYAVAKGVGHAYRAMRSKQPTGPIIVHRIGVADPRLAARMNGERFP